VLTRACRLKCELGYVDGKVVAEVFVLPVCHVTVTGRLLVVIAAAVYEVGAEVFSVAPCSGIVLRVEVTIVHTHAVPVVTIGAVAQREIAKAVLQSTDRLLGDILTGNSRNPGGRRQQDSDHHAHYDTSQQTGADETDNEEYLQTLATAAVGCNIHTKHIPKLRPRLHVRPWLHVKQNICKAFAKCFSVLFYM